MIHWHVHQLQVHIFVVLLLEQDVGDSCLQLKIPSSTKHANVVLIHGCFLILSLRKPCLRYIPIVEPEVEGVLMLVRIENVPPEGEANFIVGVSMALCKFFNLFIGAECSLCKLVDLIVWKLGFHVGELDFSKFLIDHVQDIVSLCSIRL